jgi:hypothetical protein
MALRGSSECHFAVL